MRDKLEQELKCPKKFWKSMKRMNVGNKKAGCNLQAVYDEDGNIKTGEEAVKVWREHFMKVLGESKEGTVGDVQQNGQTEDIYNCDTNGLDFSEILCQPISREEVAWALERVKKDAAPGKDGVTVDMMSAEVLFEVWFVLFEVCWKFGMVPSV